MPADRLGQRFQQGCRSADPVGQGRAIEIDAIALEDLGLPSMAIL